MQRLYTHTKIMQLKIYIYKGVFYNILIEINNINISVILYYVKCYLLSQKVLLLLHKKVNILKRI